MPEAAPYVVPLAAVSSGDVALVGGKAANLGELIGAGFAVPAGFVVTTRLYGAALAAVGATGAETSSGTGGGDPGPEVDPGRLRSVIEQMSVPDELASTIRTAYRELGQGPVAVRSSATAEDLPGAAFAGQQETYLNVVGEHAVLDAVRGCWASLWAERAVAYRSRLGYDSDFSIAVVVQRMVPSEIAGVLFTANPVTGARDEVVIEASPGLGEAVVSGLATPEHLVVDRRGRVRERRPGRHEVVVRSLPGGGVVHDQGGTSGSALPASALRALAAQGVLIGRHFARPQDIEWAYADGRVWIVQARPLTALPPAPVRTTRVQRVMGTLSAELVPTRPYPLDVTAWTIPGWFTILARMAELGAVRIDVQQMFSETDGVVDQLLPPRPQPTWRTLTAPVRLRDRVRRYDPARWTTDPRFAEYERDLGRLRSRDLAGLGWADLLAVPDDVLALLHRYVDLRIDHLPAAAFGIARLRVLLCVLGLSAEFWPLLSGQHTQTRAANDLLRAIAERIRRIPSWADAFTDQDDDDLVAAVWGGEEFAGLRTELLAWLDAYGHRETTSAALLCAPTWADEPQLLLGNLRGLVAHPTPSPAGGRDQAAEAGRRVVRRRRVRLTRNANRIVQAAQAARAALVFREDSHVHALRVRPIMLAGLLEAGRRLTDAGVLGRPRDVFHLMLGELQALPEPADLDAEQRGRLQQLVRQRSARRAELGEAPLISPATLHPGRRRPAAGALVTGSPGGGGRATGPVRVIRQPSEFGRLRAGEILVCPYTNPAWTPLFSIVAAVVADSGSFGSHAAIVAREYGIPAVMGTGNGTEVLADRLTVTVDGVRGDVVAAEPARRHDGGVR